MTSPRSALERCVAAREQLAREVDAWVSSATATGEAYMVPLTYHWNGSALLFSTPLSSRTVRDLRRTGWTRVALPSTREVVIMDGTVEFLDPIEADPWVDQFVAQHTWDPRAEPKPYAFIRFTPREVQAWSVASELGSRVVMRDGRWIDQE